MVCEAGDVSLCLRAREKERRGMENKSLSDSLTCEPGGFHGSQAGRD